ncbi:MAG: ThuA domain-containing protein [Oscillospiraceae bacterium]|nr:ThuA domain-containing protein [Oscillospiraceae bacterium]
MARVTVWNEFLHEKRNDEVKAIYPDGIHAVIAGFLRGAGHEVGTATLEMPEHGLTAEVLEQTDVLIWWGHMAHDKVDDAVVNRVRDRVLEGMGLIVLHSGHASKIFQALMGTDTWNLRWYHSDTYERVWVVDKSHRIAQGLDDCFVIPQDEVYGEHFGIPEPEHLVFITWFPGGEVFRSGCCFHRGAGKIFYFQPGHETFPIYHQSEVQTVIKNAVDWARPASINKVTYTTGNVTLMEEDA